MKSLEKHIKILTECGLITIRQEGRERHCEAKLDKLHEVSQWIEQYKVFWTKKLEALENFLSKEPPTKKRSAQKKKVSKMTLN